MTFKLYVPIPQNKDYAPLLLEGFPMLPRTQARDVCIRRGLRPREGRFRPVPLVVPCDQPLLS